MKKLSLKTAKETLTRNEMRIISGGSGGYGGSYCIYRCKTGGGSGSSSSTTFESAVSIATSNCGPGNFSIVCAG